MPALQITTSVNVASLDSNIICDLCAGKFYIDILPSVFIGGGANNIKGVKVKIVNPYGVVIKDYGIGYDIPTPANTVYQFNIPTQSGNYQYGQYLVYVKLVDADNKEYEALPKQVSPCEPDSNNKTKKTGTIYATLEGICSEGKVKVRVNNVPSYKGIISQVQDNVFKFEYPTSSGLAVLNNISSPVFSAKLFEGVYRISGSVCARYDSTDNVSYKVSYLLDVSKNIRCTIDECCVFQKLSELHQKIGAECTVKEAEDLALLTLDVLRLLTTAKMAAACGEDASDYVNDLENLLQCRCSATDGSVLLSDINPTKDFVIQGCNVEKETVGLTDTYTIENYEYVVSVNPNGGILVVSTPQLQDCTKTQVISFDIIQNYLQIKNQANSSNNEALAWAAIINKSLSGIDPKNIGLTQAQWDASTFASKISAIINKINGCCGCEAEVTIDSVDKVGHDVKVSFTITGLATSILVYLDGELKSTLLSTKTDFTFIDAADGIDHEYLFQPVCSNNSLGIAESGIFNLAGCPDILPLSVTSNNVNAPCPFDLTSLTTAIPAGITAEWHTANNTLASTLVGNPTSVSGGTYYVFGKDANGCYSTSVQVVIVCQVADSCTAPQSPKVQQLLTDFSVKLAFSSAAYPPPANSYTVKRRLASDPDVSGSYTTIGTPTWDAGLSKWVITDSTITPNVTYVWRFISNCSSSAPYVDLTYAHIACPSFSVTPNFDSLDFSIDTNGYVGGSGGEIDKYIVELWNESRTSLLASKTYNPAFPSTISDSFTGLSSGTNYYIKIKNYIGANMNDCGFTLESTSSASDLPCVDMVVAFSSVPDADGVNDDWSFQVTLDQAYDQDITIYGTIYTDNGGSNQYLFALTIPAGSTSATENNGGFGYKFLNGWDVVVLFQSIIPDVVTSGGSNYSTQCQVGNSFINVP